MEILHQKFLQKIANLDSEIENYKRLSNNVKEQKESLDLHIYSEKSKLHKDISDIEKARDKAREERLAKEIEYQEKI